MRVKRKALLVLIAAGSAVVWVWPLDFFPFFLFSGSRAEALNSPEPKPVGGAVAKLLDKSVVTWSSAYLRLTTAEGLLQQAESVRDVGDYCAVPTADWKRNFDAYSYRLLELASRQGMDAKSLEICLKRILKVSTPHVAVLPIAAVYGRTGLCRSWAITCTWEYPENDLTFGHIAVWVFRASDQKELAFMTCD